MPTLHWIGKDKVVNHHLDVPYRVLNHQYGFTSSEGKTSKATESGNKIIHGDNLEALKALLPEYEGKVVSLQTKVDNCLESIFRFIKLLIFGLNTEFSAA